MTSKSITRPLPRALALAALLGGGLLAGPVVAQGVPATPAAAMTDRAETVEQRIASLHSSLMITPAQEGNWTPVAKAMRDNAASMKTLADAKRAKMPASMTALDDMDTYEAFAQAHLDGLKNLHAAFKTLYDSMPATQKKTADAVFDGFGRPAKSNG
jgi:hypothetical protein